MCYLHLWLHMDASDQGAQVTWQVPMEKEPKKESLWQDSQGIWFTETQVKARYCKPAPVYRWQYWSSERGSQSPEVTQPASNRNLVKKYRGEPQSQKPCHEGLGPLSNSAQFPQNLQALCYPWGLIAEPDCPWSTVYSAFFTQLSSMTSQPWCDDPHFTGGKTEAQSE